MLDWQLYGANAGGHHLTNVLLHAATAILLFLVLRKMTGALWRSAFVAAVFAIHPLRVESVAWVSERKDVLSGLFFMLTLWAYARYVQESKIQSPRSKVWYGLALGLLALGLMSKSMLVTLPFVLLLLDYWPLRRLESGARLSTLDPRLIWRLVLEKIPFLLLSVVACRITLVAQEHSNIEGIQGVSPFRMAGNALVAYVVYLGHMVYPAGLALCYFPSATHLAPWKMGAALLVLAVISASVIAGWRKHPFLSVGWLWYLGMLVPLAMMQSGVNTWADRYTYLPQIGLYIMAAWGAVELCGSWRHRRIVLGSAAAAIIAGLMAAAYVQTGYWKNNISLWTHTLACTSENYVAHVDLGVALGDSPEAISHFQQALKFRPHWALAHTDLGTVFAAQGNLPEAVEQFEQALQLKPDIAQTHYDFGLVLTTQGKLEEAVQHFKRALQLKPDYVEACFHLGITLADQGKLDEAIQQYRRVLELKPDHVGAHVNLGSLLAGRKELPEAVAQFEQALQIRPDSAEAHLDLANALARQGALPEAIQHYERAIQLTPGSVEAHVNLGIALARQGELPEAIAQYDQALELQPGSAEAHLNLGDVLNCQGKQEEAARHFQHALDLATAQNKAALAETARARLKALPPVLPQAQTP
jgi:tetratricopeptide (TPR) repeat protein